MNHRHLAGLNETTGYKLFKAGYCQCSVKSVICESYTKFLKYIIVLVELIRKNINLL
jgi:hypothetical protein